MAIKPNDNIIILQYPAGGTIRPGDCVKDDGSGNAVVTTAATEAVLGVSLGDAVSGDQVAVQVTGAVELRADGNAAAIAVGDGLVPGASGVAHKDAGTATHIPFATAWKAADEDEDFIYAELVPYILRVANS